MVARGGQITAHFVSTESLDDHEVNIAYPIDVQIFNALGQLVKTVRSMNAISVSGLPQGVYLLRITDAEGKRLVVREVVRE